MHPAPSHSSVFGALRRHLEILYDCVFELGFGNEVRWDNGACPRAWGLGGLVHVWSCFPLPPSFLEWSLGCLPPPLPRWRPGSRHREGQCVGVFAPHWGVGVLGCGGSLSLLWASPHRILPTVFKTQCGLKQQIRNTMEGAAGREKERFFPAS